mmetsp:Transcript_26448/g.79941  ORF Transcript_26448/g.79941 Transcript_26448/m.79941 type:complete len:303 (+) Transcript_26448:117-1025(+)
MTAPLVQVRVRASWMSAPVLSEWTAAAKTVAGVSPVTPNTHAKVCESWPHPKPFPRMLPSLRDQRTWSAPSKSQPSGAAKTHETERTSPSTPCRTALRASRKPGCQLAVLLTRSASCGEAAAAAASAPALEARASKLQRMVDELGTPANGVVAPSDGVSAPANGVAAPANGVSAPANGVVANGAAAPANGVGARANGVSQVAFAPPASEEPEWMSEQRAGIARAAAARPTTAEADAAAAESLHVNADGYTQADAAVDRDDALRAAFASNQELKLALSEGAEGALSQAVEAELADFRRQAGMD